MKDHPQRTARLHLIKKMFAGQDWQTAAAQSQLNISRATAYRLVKLARSDDKAELAFLVQIQETCCVRDSTCSQPK